MLSVKMLHCAVTPLSCYHLYILLWYHTR